MSNQRFKEHTYTQYCLLLFSVGEAVAEDCPKDGWITAIGADSVNVLKSQRGNGSHPQLVAPHVPMCSGCCVKGTLLLLLGRHSTWLCCVCGWWSQPSLRCTDTTGEDRVSERQCRVPLLPRRCCCVVYAQFVNPGLEM